MSIRRPAITKKIGKHRYALYAEAPTSRGEAQGLARLLRRCGYDSARVVRLQTGWVVYHYPQYLD